MYDSSGVAVGLIGIGGGNSVGAGFMSTAGTRSIGVGEVVVAIGVLCATFGTFVGADLT